jgi:hypothetical protein
MDRHFEKLQNLSHDKKIMIMWIGAPLATVIIISGWFAFAGFGINEISAKKPVESENISKWEVFKNGFKATFQETQSFIKDAREKISETGLFGGKAPETSIADNVNSQQTAEVNNSFAMASSSDFKINSVEIGKNNDVNSNFKITSVKIGKTTIKKK